MTKNVQLVFITVACVAAYFTVRSLPLQKCTFLHYGEFINDEGVIEGCGYEETDFFVMADLRFPIIAKFTSQEAPEPAKFLTSDLTLFTTSGRPIRWEDIAVSHTERIHAMIVDASLTDYQHVHPQPAGPAGHYTVNWSPKKAGVYKIYLDFIPLINSRRTLLETEFFVPGTPELPIPANRQTYQTNKYTFYFDSDVNTGIRAGEDHVFKLTVKSTGGSPIIFSPVMDSYAHLVAFDKDRRGFAHLHPLNPFVKGQDPTNPDLRFALRFDKPGYFRVWAQMVLDDEEIFVPFDIIITESVDSSKS